MDDNERIVIGNNNKKDDPKEKAAQHGYLETQFVVPTTEVTLPSKGVFYPNKQETVKLKYLTASEDDILFSTELIKSGKVLDYLLNNSIIGDELRPDDMISGDKNYLLIELRKTGFGNDYKPGKIICGSCGEADDPTIDLSKLKPRYLTQLPDETGHYSVELPITKMTIKFRLLRGSDEKRLSKMIESGQKKKNGVIKVSKLITERYLLQIAEVNGNNDKLYISKFIISMPTQDSLFFRAYNREIEPGIDLEYDFECPYCNHVEAKDVPINSKLFYPDIE